MSHRQTGMGLANTMSRLGSIMAPLVKMAGELFPALPFVIYGAAPVVSGLVAAFLPETRNMALPETVEEVEGRWGWRGSGINQGRGWMMDQGWWWDGMEDGEGQGAGQRERRVG